VAEEKTPTSQPQPSSPQASEPAASNGADAEKPSEPSLEERIAEIERRQGRRTYFGAAAALVAIAAAAAALVLGVINKNDAASKDDLGALQDQLNNIQTEVKRATEKELKTVNDQIATLQQTTGDLKKKQAQDTAAIASLKSQVTTALATRRAGTGTGAGTRTGAGAGTGTPGGGATGGGGANNPGP
jgi:uncharacterized protein HemX